MIKYAGSEPDRCGASRNISEYRERLEEIVVGLERELALGMVGIFGGDSSGEHDVIRSSDRTVAEGLRPDRHHLQTIHHMLSCKGSDMRQNDSEVHSSPPSALLIVGSHMRLVTASSPRLALPTRNVRAPLDFAFGFAQGFGSSA
jgi:hypothetical protein